MAQWRKTTIKRDNGVTVEAQAIDKYSAPVNSWKQYEIIDMEKR